MLALCFLLILPVRKGTEVSVELLFTTEGSELIILELDFNTKGDVVFWAAMVIV